jgi:protein-S-isoprenylcysteine O-methyltransferase Ste14
MAAIHTKPNEASLQKNIARRFLQVGGTLVFQLTVLLLSAGRLDWIWAWVFTGIYLIGISINAYFMLRRSPETVAERGRAGEMKAWDRLVGGLWAVTYFIILLVVAGLDLRFGWTAALPLNTHLAGGLVFALGLALFSWAMIANAFFSTVARIQADRGQQVFSGGPYRAVRHPGYLGAILQSLGLPLLLGSLWALLPGLLAALLMVVRTALEDRMLQAELPGYPEYAQRVRYRLLPGIW